MLKINYVGRLFENTFKVEKHTHSTWGSCLHSGKGYVEIGGEKIPLQKTTFLLFLQHTPYGLCQGRFRNYHYNLSEFEYNRTGYIKFRDDGNKTF